MCCHVGAAGPVFGRLNGLRLRTNRVQTGMHDEEMNTSQTDNKTRPTGLYGTGLCKHVYIKGSFGHDNKTKNEQLHICHRFSSTRGFREVLCSEHETHFFFTLCIFVLTGNRGAIGFLLRSSSSFVQRPRWKRYNLTAEGAGCKTVTLTDDGYSIESDTPKSTGGSGTAPQPVQLLLAALVGCEQATAKFVAMKMRVPPIRRIQFLGVDDATWIPVWWPLKRPGLMTNPVMHKFVYINKTTRPTRFELHAERDEWGSLAGPIDQHPLQPSRLQRIWGTAHVYSDANASQIRAISEAVKKRCPVASMVIESGCELDVRWVKADE
ncbi:unnamed protein product [Durusdinium trenchii]|uniref:Uncharacterized protein n=1 Tax=Durusdinium trenchii TaxID=1381693 RepID=A0ABP0P1X4_9DINO